MVLKDMFRTSSYGSLERSKTRSLAGFRLDNIGRCSFRGGDLSAGKTVPWITMQELISRNSVKRIYLTIFALLFYLGSYVLFFKRSRNMGTVDSLYFSIVTLATVGYGDFYPVTGAEKTFCVLMTFIAVSLIAGCLGLVLDDFVSSSLDADWKRPSKLFIVLELVFVLFLIVLAGAVPYSYIEQQPLTDAMYWASISVLTVGYGDMSPKTQNGRLFALIYIFVGTLLTARALSKLVSFPIRLARRQMEYAVEHQFGRTLSPHKYRSIQKKVKKLKIQAPDPHAITQAEFTLAMLVSLGRISEQDIDECAESFQQFDACRGGMLREYDVCSPFRRSNTEVVQRDTPKGG